MGMKKITGIYALVVGIAVLGLWALLLLTDQVPELETDPYSIALHLAAEGLMALLLLIGGIGVLKGKTWGRNLYTLATGFLLYSTVNSSGYYIQDGNIQMLVLFSVLLLSAVFMVTRLWRIRA